MTPLLQPQELRLLPMTPLLQKNLLYQKRSFFRASSLVPHNRLVHLQAHSQPLLFPPPRRRLQPELPQFLLGPSCPEFP